MADKLINSKQIHELPPINTVGLNDMLPIDVDLGNEIKTFHVKVKDLVKAQAQEFIDVYYPAYLVQNTEFGFIKPKTACKYLGMQVYIHEAADGVIDLDIITLAGTLQNKNVVLAAGELYKEVIFGVPLNMTADSIWKLKIKSCGDESPGAYLHARLIIETN